MTRKQLSNLHIRPLNLYKDACPQTINLSIRPTRFQSIIITIYQNWHICFCTCSWNTKMCYVMVTTSVLVINFIMCNRGNESCMVIAFLSFQTREGHFYGLYLVSERALYLIQEKPNSHFVSHTICFMVKHQSSVTFKGLLFKGLLSKTLEKLNNIEIRSTNNNYNYFATFLTHYFFFFLS